MKIVMQIALVAIAGTALGGCVKTVEPELPAGLQAYETIGIAPEQAFPGEYTLRSGDRIDVSVFGEDDFSAKKLLIDSSGNIALPLIGTVKAAGLTQSELSATVRDRLGSRYLRDPRVSIVVDSPALATVAVEGEVEQPGVYEVMPGQTLLAAVAMARSPTDTAKLDEVLIFRTIDGVRMGGRFDLAMIRAGRVPDPAVYPGDVVVVGFSQVRGVYQDFLKLAPIFNLFTRF